jgi:hypothetical protein
MLLAPASNAARIVPGHDFLPGLLAFKINRTQRLNRFSRHARNDRAEVLDQAPDRDLFRDVSLFIQEMY